MLDAKLAASRNTAMEISNAPNFASAFTDWNSISPAAGISRSPAWPGGVLASVGVLSEERGDLRQRPRILEELGVTVIVAIRC